MTTASTDLHRTDRPASPGPASPSVLAEAEQNEFGAAPRLLGPGGGPVRAWGRDPAFLRIVADVARAAERSLRVSSGEGAPLWGPLDTLVIEAESVPELLAQLEEPDRTGPCPSAVVAGREGGRDPWRAASELARHGKPPAVVMLPQGRAWLAEHLTLREERPVAWPRIGVVGASGGIGTSTISLWLGARLLGRGEPVVVVDAVPASIGLDTCVAPAPVTGMRWEELTRLSRLPDGTALLEALPAPHGLPILTFESPTAARVAVPPILAGTGAADDGAVALEHPPRSSRPSAARSAGDGAPTMASATPWELMTAFSGEAMTVFDLGSAAGLAPPAGGEARWLTRCSALVLLVPFTLRGLSQAREVRRRWDPLMPLVLVGVGPRLFDVTEREVTRMLGTRLSAVVPHVASVYEAYESGHLLEAGSRRSLRRPMERVVDAVLGAVEEAPRARGRAASAEREAGPRHRGARTGRDGASSGRGVGR